MKITILQPDISWARPAANRQHADTLLSANPGSDLYVLPEMFATGFCTNPADIAEPAEGPTLQWMKEKSAALQAALAGSVAVRQGTRYYNRFYFVEPHGTVHAYDKKHLFTYGGEDQHYTPGSERVVVTSCGVRILLQICYDLRFPVWSRNRGDYDLILYVASWPTTRIEVWNTLLRARAIENQCYVAGVNRVGTDPYCSYSGGSALIDPYGRTLATCPFQAEGAATATVNLPALQAFRKKFPVLNDADPLV